jgi:glycosyltransferase involved in cell wall biosynthesis
MKKIAFLLPSLANTGPIIVAKDIINSIVSRNTNKFNFTVFYFDDIIELEFNCQTERVENDICHKLLAFDIIHSHGYRPDKFLFKNRNRITAKTISTIHCDVFQDLKHSYNYFISKIFGYQWIRYLKLMDQLVCLTNEHKIFYSKFMSIERLRVIYNGRGLNDNVIIDKQDELFFMKLRKKYPKHKVLGSFAGLTSRKGIDMVLKAIKEVKDCLYVVIGDGKEKQKLIEQAKLLGLQERCFFLGYRRNAHRYFKSIDAYMLPSRSEAFPLALIEAALNGIPSVCSNIKVLKEVFTEDEVFFFELENIKSLESAIKESIQDISSKGEKAKLKAVKYYTASVMAENYKQLYKSVI